MEIAKIKDKLKYYKPGDTILVEFRHADCVNAIYLFGLHLTKKIQIRDIDLDLSNLSQESLLLWANTQDSTFHLIITQSFRTQCLINCSPMIKRLSVF